MKQKLDPVGCKSEGSMKSKRTLETEESESEGASTSGQSQTDESDSETDESGSDTDPPHFCR